MRYYNIFVITETGTDDAVFTIRRRSEEKAHETVEKIFEQMHAFPKNMVKYHTTTISRSWTKRKIKQLFHAFDYGYKIGVNRNEIFYRADQLDGSGSPSTEG